MYQDVIRERKSLGRLSVPERSGDWTQMPTFSKTLWTSQRSTHSKKIGVKYTADHPTLYPYTLVYQARGHQQEADGSCKKTKAPTMLLES